MMALKLCASCCCLPPVLFQAEHDEQGLTGGPEIQLPPFYELRRLAAGGCKLCKIWTANPNIEYIPETLLHMAPIILRRSQIAPHMSVTAFIGMDPVFVTYFSRIPPIWGELVDDVINQFFADAIDADLPALRDCDTDRLESFLGRSWLEVCRSQHADCNKALESTNDGPSRLLDLQAFDNSDDVRLIDCTNWGKGSDGFKFPKFVCLSHCWGEPSARPKMTKKATISQHLNCVSHCELSRTFQDAIRISRQLEYVIFGSTRSA